VLRYFCTAGVLESGSSAIYCARCWGLFVQA
jgi:hypothetical protein